MSALGISEGSELAMDQAGDEFYIENCSYIGTDYLHIKIYLIGVFGTSIALLNLMFNSFFTLVFVTNQQLRRSPLYYFGILAILDILLAINYILLMSTPVYFDQFEQLWLYHLFLSYLAPTMTVSNTAMFASMLLIFMATLERLLRTFQYAKLSAVRQFLERRRPQVCFCCIGIAFLYKLCTYFELHYVENDNCTEWAQYEIRATALSMIPEYRFWWMFIARNLIDRIIPFFILVLINFLIIRTLKREFKNHNDLRPISMGEVSNKKILRESTRALIALVSLYLMSQTLQVVTTFWEVFDRNSLEYEYSELYSYLNDVMSLMTLLSSTLRFPVYCSCNQEIYEASRAMLIHFKTLCSNAKFRSAEYLPISVKNKDSIFKSEDRVPSAAIVNDGNVLSITEDSTTWML